jgi:hypothetical protein
MVCLEAAYKKSPNIFSTALAKYVTEAMFLLIDSIREKDSESRTYSSSACHIANVIGKPSSEFITLSA